MTGFNSKREAAADKLQEQWNEDGWRKNNWRCGHGWLRGEQCETCNAPKRPWVGLTDDDICELYGKDLKYRDGDYMRYGKSIEAKLKETNT